MYSFLKDVVRNSRAMADQGWAEANAGNLSLRLDEAALADWSAFSPGEWTPLRIPAPGLGGEFFALTAKGCQLRNVPEAPEKNCGVIELDAAGQRWRTVWGLEGTQPTSEMFAHLLAHQVRKAKTGGAERAILHTHPLHLIALCHVMEPDGRAMTRLLWSMHPEGVCLFPGGLGYCPLAAPGSEELARLTCAALEEHSMVLWDYHGVLASAATLDQAFGMVQAAEKAAAIYRAAREMGGVIRKLDDNMIRSVADSLQIQAAPGILNE